MLDSQEAKQAQINGQITTFDFSSSQEDAYKDRDDLEYLGKGKYYYLGKDQKSQDILEKRNLKGQYFFWKVNN